MKKEADAKQKSNSNNIEVFKNLGRWFWRN